MKNLILTMILASFLIVPSVALAEKAKAGGSEAALQTGESVDVKKAEDNKAGNKKAGGFTGPNVSRTTVAEALKLTDGAAVTLAGKIEKQLGHEKFQFNDATGSITLSISDGRWRGLSIGPDDAVEVAGKINKKGPEIEVDVKKVIKK